MRITVPYLAKFARKVADDALGPSTSPDSSGQNARTEGRPSHGTHFTKVARETSDDQ